MFLGSPEVEYKIPEFIDPEGLPVTIRLQILGSLPLPEFMKFQFTGTDFVLNIAPFKPKHIGIYMLEMSLTDKYAPVFV